MLNKNVIKYGKDLINSRYKLTENELDLLFILSAQIDKDDKDFKPLSFKITDLEAKTGKSWNDTRVKKALMGLNKKPIEIVERDKNGEITNGWHVIYWLGSIKHRDGVITVRFQEELKPFMLELQDYFEQIPLKNALQIGTTYAKRIYILLKEYEKIGHREFNLDELREVLKTPKSYENYNLLKSKVLDVAVAEINRFGDIEVGYEETEKIRKKVTSIKFTIKKNQADLSQFISYIRELYVNQPLTYYNDRLLKCATTGLLYFNDDLHTLDTKTADKAWKHIHANKERLLCFQHNLFDT